MWTQRSLSVVRGESAGIGEQISLGGKRVAGFGNIVGIAAAGDPDIWSKLSTTQQTWIVNTLTKLNDKIVQSSGTTCPTWGPSITAAGGCFQAWWNANNISPMKLRTDGVFDEDTLCALITMAGLDKASFPTLFPDPEKKYCLLPSGETPTHAKTVETVEPKKGLSTGAMVGIAAGGVAVAGGIYYVATRKGGGRRKTSRKKRKARAARRRRR